VSLVDAPMALLDRILAWQAASVQPDDPIARMIARTTGRVQPDRYYQRRLRSRVVNEFVAMREGLVPIPAAAGHMGRLGRAVLYASVGVAVSVTAVGAASTSSLPGDPLYAVKREIEQIRMDVAPASVKPDLAEMALEERLAEVEQLAEAGRWDLVAAATPQLAAAEATLSHFGRSLAPSEIASLTRHGGILARLLSAAPPATARGLERVLASADYAALTTFEPQVPADNANGGNGPDPDHQTSGKGSGVVTPTASARPRPTPQASGQAGQGGQAAVTASPTPSTAAPSPTPRPTHSPHASQDNQNRQND